MIKTLILKAITTTLKPITSLFVGNLLNKNFEDMDLNEQTKTNLRVLSTICICVLIGYLVAKGGNDALVNQLLEILKESISG